MTASDWTMLLVIIPAFGIAWRIVAELMRPSDWEQR